MLLFSLDGPSPLATALAEPLKGKLGPVAARKRSADDRASCEFAIEHGSRTAVTLLVEASEGPPFLFQCDAPSPNKDNPDCQAIWASIDLP